MLAHVGSTRWEPYRAILVFALAASVALAAVALALWQVSPYGRYLHHEGGGSAPLPLEAGLFAAGWTLMVVAMMLPSSVPLVATFGALVRRRPRPGLLVTLVVGGYIATWTTFGLVAWLLDRLIHAAVDAVPFLGAHPQLIIGATLLTAGLYQFTGLKYRCLDECRSPLGFVLNRWAGRRPEREALAMGVAHGAFCIGCCWSLMLVMFGLGLGSLAWMLAFGTLMAIEKNAPWGRRISRPLGFGLVFAAVAALSL
jgi:predicted metal-binding membrane protein